MDQLIVKVRSSDGQLVQLLDLITNKFRIHRRVKSVVQCGSEVIAARLRERLNWEASERVMSSAMMNQL